ncbi:hypothetical protein CK203_023665 [Vitis vinifera]|uniref:Rab-GAP TBC domain-containing protein n=1 Tax=Vitis vinifera TaxID=29760 RepID=A0A438JBM7_VITVI|nr:hypothetical protein CK203_023665 [Vitis vinifera]
MCTVVCIICVCAALPDILLQDIRSFFREERRVRKWRKMIGIGGSDWKHYVRRKPNVVKRRIRKGIPDCLRGLVWQLISGSRDLLLMNPGVYEVYLFLIFSFQKVTLVRFF